MVGCPFPKESDGDLDPRGRVLHLHRTSSQFCVKLADRKNVTLPHKANGEAVHGSQGISDQMIIEGLKRGYEDYRVRQAFLPRRITGADD